MTNPDYTDSIICGDAMEIMAGMPDGCADITVTSPPYNHLGKENARAHGWSKGTSKLFKHNAWYQSVLKGEIYDDSMPEEQYQEWLELVVSEMMRVSRGLVWINHKIRYRDGVGIHPLRYLPFDVWSEVIWRRNGSMALNCKRFAPSHELIYGFGRPHWWNDEMNKLLSVWDICASKDGEHPCSFPIEIPTRLIEASCPPGGIVLDPFMGVGTTARAAVRTGRDYIGIDLSEKYCELARERIRIERSQLTLDFGESK